MMELLIHTGENSGTYTIDTIYDGIDIIKITEEFNNFTMPEHVEAFTVLQNPVLITLTA